MIMWPSNSKTLFEVAASKRVDIKRKASVLSNYHFTPGYSLPEDHFVTSTHREARRLAQLGILVGSLDGKKPNGELVPNGLHGFTTNLEQIDFWWSRHIDDYPDLGARPPKGYVVIDVDARHGGVETWEELNENHDLPKTIVTKTGGGGNHYWFRLPYEAELHGQLAPGIDIRHDRNYLVMPGSLHPKTLEEYEYLSWIDLLDVPMLPTHLRRFVYKPARPITPVIPLRLRFCDEGSHLVEAVQEAVPGLRNETLNTAAFLAAKNGYDVFDDLALAAESVGLSLSEIDATINSGKTAGEKETRQ